jgi:D-glycero-alpha-D-manno-heptose-7-phosphate kinase
MIIVRSPFRIPLAGGGTDLDFYYKKRGGDLISATFNQYIYHLISFRTLDKKILIQTTDTQFANKLNDVKNKLIKGVLFHFKIKKSIQVASISTLPTRTGLGSSSAFIVGLVKALAQLKKINLSKKQLASISYYIERKKLKLDGGCQDQIMASYGGIQRIKINKKGNFNCKSLKISKSKLENLEKSFFLVFTNEARDSKNIITQQRENIKNSIIRYDKIKSKVKILENALIEGNKKKIGLLFHEHWIEKKKLSSNISNKKFDKMYREMMNSCIFYGGKIIGAGAGGFFLMVAKNTKNAQAFLKKKKFKFLKIKFDFSGAKIIKDIIL